MIMCWLCAKDFEHINRAESRVVICLVKAPSGNNVNHACVMNAVFKLTTGLIVQPNTINTENLSVGAQHPHTMNNTHDRSPMLVWCMGVPACGGCVCWCCVVCVYMFAGANRVVDGEGQCRGTAFKQSMLVVKCHPARSCSLAMGLEVCFMQHSGNATLRLGIHNK